MRFNTTSKPPGESLMGFNPAAREIAPFASTDTPPDALRLPKPYWESPYASVYLLPASTTEPRGKDGHFNVHELLRRDRANAVLRSLGHGFFEVTVLARAAAGRIHSRRMWRIDELPATEVDHLIDAFSACRWGELRSPVFRAWK